MITLILALVAGLLVAYFSGSAMNNMAWGTILGILTLIAVQVTVGFIIRRKVNKVHAAIQLAMQEAQAKLQRKVNMMQSRPGASVKAMQAAVEKDQQNAVHQALEMTKALERYYLWSPLLSKQINTMRMMFHYQVKEFEAVDALMKKSLFIDPTSIAMKIARMYRKNDPKLDKFARRKLKSARGEAGALLFALYSWILVKRGDIKGAIAVLADSKKRCGNETLNANMERLANDKVKNFSNAPFGEMWYMLYLEEPKVRQQKMRPQY